MSSRSMIVLCGLVLVLAACGDDAAVVPDAGAMDAGAIDAGALDGGALDADVIDSGAIDAGADAATELDAGSDAGEPDGGPTACGVSGGECDVALQDCTGKNEGCYFAEVEGVSSTRCELVFTAGAEGDSCETADECVPGLTCRAGTCREYCCPGGGATCPDGQDCILLFEAPNIGHCAPLTACDLVPNAGCASPTQACYPAPTLGTVGCFGAGAFAEGDACAATNQCEPGTVCLGEPGAYECIRMCRTAMGAADCVVAGHDCTALEGYLPEGFGICVVPE